MKTKKIDIKNILYTTDLSDTALHAFSYAASLANLYGAAITVLHVMGEYEYDAVKHELSGLLSPEQWRSIKAHHEQDARASLVGKRRDNVMIRDALVQFTEDTRQPDAGAQSDEVLVLYGDPVDKVILETAKQRNADMIVMGMHGHGLIREIVGTTTSKVLRKAKIPVLTVRLDRK